jgi:hypothetical protein
MRKDGYAGTGKAQHNSAEWIEAPDAVPTRQDDQDRLNFTQKRHTVQIPNPRHGKGLADGLRELPGTEGT